MARRADRSGAADLPGVFGWLISAWSVSLVGDGFRVIGLPLLAFSISPTPASVAAVAAFSALPWLLVGIPAGALVDRMSTGRVMVIADAVRAVISVALVGLISGSSVTIPLLCGVGFLLTAAETFADGAGQTLMVRVVPSGQLEIANSRFVVAQTVALDLIGPLGAGVSFVFSPQLPFAISASAYALSAAVTLGSGRRYPQIWPASAVRADVAESAPHADEPKTVLPPRIVREFRRSIAAGLRRLWTDPVLRTLVITVGVLSTANAAIDGVLVVYAKRSLGLSAALYPTLLVSYSIGILLSAVIVPRIRDRVSGGRVMMVAMAGLGGTMLVMGLIVQPLVAWICYGLMGVAGGTWNVLSATRRQRLTPQDMVARVSSAFRVIAFGVIPVGALAGGQLGEHQGVPAVFTVAGSVVLVLLVVVARSFSRTDTAAPTGAAGVPMTWPSDEVKDRPPKGAYGPS